MSIKKVNKKVIKEKVTKSTEKEVSLNVLKYYLELLSDKRAYGFSLRALSFLQLIDGSLNEQQIKRIKKFINDNKSFINLKNNV